jgi:hypothetical protein
MEQYFAQFDTTFAGTALSFIAPIFPALSSVSAGFAVVMIVFEIMLGVMLMLGNRPKFTAWAFLLLVVFFTFLTGFTYLTGYVPNDANFFDFGKWGAFSETNMRVTDCGCFGDFLKLKPKVSFFKDIFLLIPSFLFVFATKTMHRLFKYRIRLVALWASTILFLLFSLYNFIYDLPVIDFRPFKEGTNVRAEKQRQIDAIGAVPLVFVYRNPKDTTETKQFKDNELDKIPEGWEFVDRTQAYTVETNKIYDFGSIMGETLKKTTYLYYDDGSGEAPIELSPEDTLNGMVEEGWKLVDSKVSEEVAEADVTENILNNKNNHIMIVCHDLKKTNKNAFATKIAAIQKDAKAAGIDCYAVVGKANKAEIEEFKKAMGVDFPFYSADDILLKTILRSNPGTVLWKDGVILKEWHHRHVPNFETMKSFF